MKCNFTKIVAVTVTLLCTLSTAIAQDTQVQKDEMFTKFEGKLKTRVFADFTQGVYSNNEITGFNIKRAVLGYTGTFGGGLSADLEIDFASTENDSYSPQDEYATYVRNAELIWEKGDIEMNFGVVTPKIFNYLENFWGYRYIVKSAMDEYSFGHSRDLGYTISYNIADWISIDGSALNGDGYKYFEQDNNLKLGFGVTVELFDALYFRGYAESYDDNDITLDEIGTKGKDQQILSAFLGYKRDGFSIGVEYDYMWNTKFNIGKNQSILSTYGRYIINNNHSVFARYDNIQSTDNWNGNEKAYYLGFEYQPVKYVKLGPTFTYKQEYAKEGAPFLGFFLELRY